MMADARVPLALYHILDAIGDFNAIVGEITASELASDRIKRYASERCIEIISEASRRIPTNGRTNIQPSPGRRLPASAA